MLQATISALIALFIGAAGGFVFHAIHAPLPWTLGAIAASAVAAITVNRWPMPAGIRSWARPVVGVLAGSAFTPDVIASMGGWWPALLLVAVYSLAVSAIGYITFTRLLGFDSPTAYFAATPGGLGELTLLGGTLGADSKTLVLIHAVRVVAVVFTIPLMMQLFLSGPVGGLPPQHAEAHHELGEWLVLVGCGVLGFFIARYTRMPGGALVVPMFLSAAAHAAGLTSASPPYWLVAFVQVLIGSIAGSRFAGVTLVELRRSLAIAIAWAAFMVLSAVAAALAGSLMLGMPFSWLLLALAPGGAAEMLVITYALRADVAFVALCQVARVFLVMALAPLFFKYVPSNDPDEQKSGR